MKISGLLHLLNWYSDEIEFELTPGLKILNLQGTDLLKLYIDECLKKDLDYGEPFEYQTALEIDTNKIESWGDDFIDPYSQGSRMLNLLTIYFGSPLGMVRIIHSTDEYKTLHFTRESQLYTAQIDFLITYHHGIRKSDIEEIKKMARNTSLLWDSEKASSRIINGLTYYFYSWNIHYLEQSAINLAIALECLFSPFSNNELSHQISFNVANFLSRKRKEKENIYKQFKKFYSIRSKIVHGELIHNKDIDVITKTFIDTSLIIKQILSDIDLIKTFNDNKLRKDYLNDLVFS